MSTDTQSFDFISIVLPVVLSAIVTFVGIAISKFSRTSFNAVTGTVRIEGLQEQMIDMKKTIKDGLDEVEGRLDRKDEYFRLEFNRIWSRIEENSKSISLHDYRLDEIQKRKEKGSGAV